MAKLEGELGEELEVLKSDLTQLRSDIRGLSESLMGTAKTRARDIKDQAGEHVEHSVASVEQYIEAKPLTSVLVAFGIGIVLGKLFDRR